MNTPETQPGPCLLGPDLYVDLRGRPIPMGGLDDDERALVEDLFEFFEGDPDWNEFENEAFARVDRLYESRGLTQEETSQTEVFEIAQDLGGRIAVRQGFARMPDYRDELADLIRRRFKTRREFCRATGISEDMLSHVLARRKHLSIESLTQALARIGYTLQIMPVAPVAEAER